MTNLLTLDSKHPGLNDLAYVQRRTDFFNLGRMHRLQQDQPPLVEYLAEENAIWQRIYEKLTACHEAKACQIYLAGKQDLALETHRLPQLRELSARLERKHQVRLAPAEGLLASRDFFAYLSNRTMPCTQFLRHGSDPEYTPEPDIVHDVIGHLPPLMNDEYADLMQLIGLGVRGASESELPFWERIYWFTIEFGLILEKEELKVLGAGLLSSYGEMEFCFSNHVERRPFDLEEVMHTNYDPTQMQRVLFYIPSLQHLKTEIQKLLLRGTHAI